ncbi:AI-2E family transporter [Oceanirhabdus sp. W0125-5]|uniref:AI-2E family transporter n=1 Tax=Oceanirhabdus sp. W0125-5 TaxID=2999116 RepID=UPI0022F2E45E|nr:AI-2E family transporter [Oceanirhabdus sp. W0125-5]WBW94825.1 AI-2E family transporter [Oceanirhabdus sp. W0125-5]
MNKRKRIFIEVVVLFGIFALGAVFINHFFKPMILFVILLIVAIPIDGILKKKITNANIRATIMILIINTIVVLLIMFIGGFFYNKIIYILRCGAVNVVNNIKILLINLENNIKYEEIMTKLYSQLTNLSGIILTKGATYTTNSLSTYVFANIMLFFALKDKEAITKFMSALIGYRALSFFRVKLNEFRVYFKIQLMLVGFSALQITLGFMVLGIKDFLSYGIICGLLDILPIVGMLLVFVPLILINLYYKKYILVIGLGILYLYISITREILQTKFASSSLNIHPLVLFVSVYMGYQIQGFTGSIMLLFCAISIKEWIKGYNIQDYNGGKI